MKKRKGSYEKNDNSDSDFDVMWLFNDTITNR